jgi:hypothetical protein
LTDAMLIRQSKSKPCFWSFTPVNGNRQISVVAEGQS